MGKIILSEKRERELADNVKSINEHLLRMASLVGKGNLSTTEDYSKIVKTYNQIINTLLKRLDTLEREQTIFKTYGEVPPLVIQKILREGGSESVDRRYTLVEINKKTLLEEGKEDEGRLKFFRNVLFCLCGYVYIGASDDKEKENLFTTLFPDDNKKRFEKFKTWYGKQEKTTLGGLITKLSSKYEDQIRRPLFYFSGLEEYNEEKSKTLVEKLEEGTLKFETAFSSACALYDLLVYNKKPCTIIMAGWVVDGLRQFAMGGKFFDMKKRNIDYLCEAIKSYVGIKRFVNIYEGLTLR